MKKFNDLDALHKVTDTSNLLASQVKHNYCAKHNKIKENSKLNLPDINRINYLDICKLHHVKSSSYQHLLLDNSEAMVGKEDSKNNQSRAEKGKENVAPHNMTTRNSSSANKFNNFKLTPLAQKSQTSNKSYHKTPLSNKSQHLREILEFVRLNHLAI